MQVKFPAEDKLGEGKAGGFLLKEAAFMKREDRKLKNCFPYCKIQLFLSLYHNSM